ncbi:MAG: MarR family transcriptional regulator [Oscillospiraceae bacterium]|nr:MarR family transcriptional regulator [Oscillospiraceae bacterium]
MSEKKTYKDLPLTPYELAELDCSRNQVYEQHYRTPFDYGTGEKYTPLEAHFVNRVYFHPGITIKDMAILSKRTKSAVSQMASKLVAKDVLRFEPHPTDARQIKLYVTPKGDELCKAHMRHDNESYGAVLKQLIDTYGFKAVESYLEILQFMSELEE